MQDEIKEVIKHYPKEAKLHFMQLRGLVVDQAQKLDIQLHETLKWGEPSYLCKNGSTIRIAWHKKTPHEIGVYFHCKSLLIEAIKELYPNTFICEGNRALLFQLNSTITVTDELAHCFSLALLYHKIKHLPLLGV